MATKMHDDEIEIDAPLVRRLLEEQFPQWATLPVERVELMGTDNALYRLGEQMVVRLPRIAGAARSLETETRWLPRIGPHLPLAAPAVLGEGKATDTFPLGWAVLSWLPGERATLGGIRDQSGLAADLAGLISALQRIDTPAAPLPGELTSGRGGPLAERDTQTQAWLEELESRTDTRVMRAVWEEALHAAVWDGPPVWVHGDLDAQNLLMSGGRVTGVIDFGCMGVGDPACDVMVAWKLLTPSGRAIFRDALSVDDATWARSRGWIASQAAGVLAYYTEENHPVLVRAARHWVAEISRP